MQRLLLTSLFTGLLGVGANAQTALDDYVATPDPAYFWGVYDDDGGLLAEHYFLRLVSQSWRDFDEVDRPLWEHELKITVPNFDLCDFDATRDTVVLVISGGDYPGDDIDDYSDEVNEIAEPLALTLCAVVAELKQVPNQPLNFTDEFNRPRTEDEILSYGMDKFLETGDPTWLAHLPMTKAAVAAMDAIQEFMDQEEDQDIDHFVVLGGSKRGWTTWLSAAVDERIKAIIPISIDLLNIDEQFRHHWETLGFYAPAIAEYEEYDLGCRLTDPLLEIIDPLSYADRYEGLPKFLINSAGDQFFMPDSSRFYYEQLPGPKKLRYTVNTDHAQGDTEDIIDLFLGARAWIDDVNDGNDGPQFTWTFEPDGSIRVVVEDDPDEVVLWQASNPAARDFRLEAIGDAWTQTELDEVADNTYVGFVPPPTEGWTAFLVELRYEDSLFQGDQLYTTGVRITPDTLPFQGTACQSFPDYTNFWWTPTLPGQAIQTRQDGDRIGGAWYLYDENAQGFWVTFDWALDGDVAAGDLLRFTGPDLGAPWDPEQVDSQVVGMGSIEFLSTRAAEFRYTLNGVPGLLNLVPFNRLADADTTGIWFDPAQNGQGVQLLKDGDALSGAWYHYGPDGQAAWHTFVGTLEGDVVETELLRFTGPGLGFRWDEDEVDSDPAGSVRVELRGADSVRLDYDLDGATGGLDLVPFRVQ